jgi:hypothetical protein
MVQDGEKWCRLLGLRWSLWASGQVEIVHGEVKGISRRLACDRVVHGRAEENFRARACCDGTAHVSRQEREAHLIGSCDSKLVKCDDR